MDIKPALTPEEWAGPRPIDCADFTAQVKRRGDGTHRIYLTDLWHPVSEPQSLHALAALALHGQPFGFTWEDVDLLLAQAEYDETDLGMWNAKGYRSPMRPLADRIAALLPPRE